MGRKRCAVRGARYRFAGHLRAHDGLARGMRGAGLARRVLRAVPAVARSGPRILQPSVPRLV